MELVNCCVNWNILDLGRVILKIFANNCIMSSRLKLFPDKDTLIFADQIHADLYVCTVLLFCYIECLRALSSFCTWPNY